MRVVAGLALGTYYAAGAEAARQTPNASPMRGLVYAVKDNRDPPNAPQAIAHPLHPARGAVMVDRDNAIDYVAAMFAKRIELLAKFFGAKDPQEVALVPVPSSSVTATTIETARFRTLRLCRSLAGAGLGTVAVLAVQERAVVPKTEGGRRTASEILRGLTRTPTPIPRAQVIVLVDDNVQSGASIAAMDTLLGGSRQTCAFAVAVTDAQPCPDAMQRRRFYVDYDDEAPDLDVHCGFKRPT
jgi:hypothetical protein